MTESNILSIFLHHCCGVQDHGRGEVLKRFDQKRVDVSSVDALLALDEEDLGTFLASILIGVRVFIKEGWRRSVDAEPPALGPEPPRDLTTSCSAVRDVMIVPHTLEQKIMRARRPKSHLHDGLRSESLSTGGLSCDPTGSRAFLLSEKAGLSCRKSTSIRL